MAAGEQIHRVGILGYGNIFGRYVTGMSRYPELRIVRVGDVDAGRAEQAAAEFDLPAWGDDADLYADDSVDIVVNLTPPVHHAATITNALSAGRHVYHVYVEKPLATTAADAREVLGAVGDRVLGSRAPEPAPNCSASLTRWVPSHRASRPISPSPAPTR